MEHFRGAADGVSDRQRCNAGAHIQQRTGEQLAAAAGKYGIPLAGETDPRMAEYFEARCNAVLTYNK